jgi:hypothetical protein
MVYGEFFTNKLKLTIKTTEAQGNFTVNFYKKYN